MTRTVPVRPDGRISLPLLDDVKASGLTPMELRAALIKSFQKYMPSPMVSVMIRASQPANRSMVDLLYSSVRKMTLQL